MYYKCKYVFILSTYLFVHYSYFPGFSELYVSGWKLDKSAIEALAEVLHSNGKFTRVTLKDAAMSERGSVAQCIEGLCGNAEIKLNVFEVVDAVLDEKGAASLGELLSTLAKRAHSEEGKYKGLRKLSLVNALEPKAVITLSNSLLNAAKVSSSFRFLFLYLLVFFFFSSSFSFSSSSSSSLLSNKNPSLYLNFHFLLFI